MTNIHADFRSLGVNPLYGLRVFCAGPGVSGLLGYQKTGLPRITSGDKFRTR